MTIGAIAAIYLSIWAIALLLAISWRRRAEKGARHMADGVKARVPLMPMMISTSFVAALLTGISVFLLKISG